MGSPHTLVFLLPLEPLNFLVNSDVSLIDKASWMSMIGTAKERERMESFSVGSTKIPMTPVVRIRMPLTPVLGGLVSASRG